MAELVRWYVGTLPVAVASLQGAHATGDLAAVRRELHMLKGNAGGYGFGPISEAAHIAEINLTGIEQLSAREANILEPLVKLCRHVAGYDIALEPRTAST